MKRIYRSKDDGIICGICAGVAKTFDLDPSIVRIATVVLIFTAGVFPVLIGYGVGALIIPEEGGLS
jgi:phage shock protein C